MQRWKLECFSFHRKKIYSLYLCTVYSKYTVCTLHYSEVILKKSIISYATVPEDHPHKTPLKFILLFQELWYSPLKKS